MASQITTATRRDLESCVHKPPDEFRSQT